MRKKFYSWVLATIAIAGCQRHDASQGTPRAGNDANKAADSNAGMRTGGGESDRAADQLKKADTGEPPVPSSTAPDIGSARGENQSSDGADRE